MRKNIFIFIIILVLTLFFSSFATADTCGGTVQCHCGDMLIESQTMWYDLINCPEGGLEILTSNISLDCNGHLIDGVGAYWSSGIGVGQEVTVTNCNVQEFYRGIIVTKGSSDNTISYNTVHDNSHDGIILGEDSYHNVLYDNTIINNQVIGIFLSGSIYNNIWNNVFVNNGLNAYDGGGSNNWNVGDVGNSWSDFSSNPGYPDYYQIPGYGIDWHPSFVEFYVDDSDLEFVIFSGEWNSRNHPNAYNGETLYNNPGFGLERAGWKVNELVFPGTYDIYVWKFEHEYLTSMTTNVHYMVYHRTGTSNWITVNQQTTGNEWIYLGEFEFDNSHGQGVMITDEANGRIIADAIKLVYTEPLSNRKSSGKDMFD